MNFQDLLNGLYESDPKRFKKGPSPDTVKLQFNNGTVLTTILDIGNDYGPFEYTIREAIQSHRWEWDIRQEGDGVRQARVFANGKTYKGSHPIASIALGMACLAAMREVAA